jgi:hypothetical protein
MAGLWNPWPVKSPVYYFTGQLSAFPISDFDFAISACQHVSMSAFDLLISPGSFFRGLNGCRELLFQRESQPITNECCRIAHPD